MRKKKSKNKSKCASTEQYNKNEAAGNLLTIRQASGLLNVHENTLRRWSDSGVIKVYRLGPGGSRRYLKEDVVILLNEYNINRQADEVKLVQQRRKVAQRIAQRLQKAQNSHSIVCE